MTKLIFTFLVTMLVMGSPVQAQEETTTESTAEIVILNDLTKEYTLDEFQLLVSPLTLEQLTEEVATWQAIVQLSMSQMASLKVAAMRAEGDEATPIHDKLNALSAGRIDLISKFNMIIDSMEAKGGDPELVNTYRQYVPGAFVSEIAATDVKTLFSAAISWIISSDGGLSLVLRLGTIIGSLFLLILIARAVRSVARRGIRRIQNLSQLLQDFLLKVVYWLTFVIGFMVVLSLLGIDITPLFAVVGGASFIIAFAMQDTLGNLASGLMIMVNKPFDVGDLVDTNGILGEVEAVSIVSTTVRTLDNQVVILPNSQVWGSIITNVTVSPVRRIDMVFGIGYGDDIETASKVLQGLVDQHPLVLDKPEPNIKVHELADSSVNFICRPWVNTEDYWTVYWDLTRQAKEGFDSAGVSIPFPQRDVHLFKEG